MPEIFQGNGCASAGGLYPYKVELMKNVPILILNTKTNAITEVIFDDALKQAQELDREFQATKMVKGPLHGIPVTVKDQFNIKGYDSTLGYVGRSFKPAAEDAVIVQILKDLGAVVIAKTNLPQSIMV